ncbi:2-oxoglutarate-Fe(II) type oxidoreductase hxnY isoform F [Glycine soja]|uniref:2-oxoglutarate-Fe(II) type oxidoreductase hxnY isoform F n=2 Tax=Glycine soja TaxID=3848 RepID=A0A445HWJ1_GLYSO|nr:2-oxoglutarate-Fe(II) type oxidoreductase hxnY isoform F [Glycine soja]
MNLPIIDFYSAESDRLSTAISIRQACIEYGFFYLVNHGVENDLVRAFDESKRFFSLPLEDKMKLAYKEFRGYTPPDPSLGLQGDSKESYYIGPLSDSTSANLNQWPSQGTLAPCGVGKKLLSLIALSLNMDEDFFEKIGAEDKPAAFLRLLHYPEGEGDLGVVFEAEEGGGEGDAVELEGGVVVLQEELRDQFDVAFVARFWHAHPLSDRWSPRTAVCIFRAFIVNIGDLMERWTNCLYRSTMHRVKQTGKERYSENIYVSFFLPIKECASLEISFSNSRLFPHFDDHLFQETPSELMEHRSGVDVEGHVELHLSVRGAGIAIHHMMEVLAGTEGLGHAGELFDILIGKGRKEMNLPIIDLSSPDPLSTAISIRQACIEYGFFYLVNHGVENDLVKAFDESKRFFSLPPGEKMKLARKEFRGYTPQDPTLGLHGDSKESYYIGPMADSASVKLNQWPSEELLENWRPSIEAIYWKLFEAGKKLYSLIALSLNMDEDFFDKIGAVDKPSAFLRLLRYPGEMGPHQEICSAHSDTGALTLLMTDGVPGLQICRDKLKEPRVWEDVPYMEGAFIVNIGDLMERWTNCLYRSTMHRVKRTGKERYSMAFFLDPHPDCVVECLKSCCSESCPPR